MGVFRFWNFPEEYLYIYTYVYIFFLHTYIYDTTLFHQSQYLLQCQDLVDRKKSLKDQGPNNTPIVDSEAAPAIVKDLGQHIGAGN